MPLHISYDFYEGGRHEMLNEPNRGQVRTNLLVWLSGVLGMNDQDLRRTG
jgi:alpha-beta hydrolase superfamily lysophospholipase